MFDEKNTHKSKLFEVRYYITSLWNMDFGVFCHQTFVTSHNKRYRTSIFENYGIFALSKRKLKQFSYDTRIIKIATFQDARKR